MNYKYSKFYAPIDLIIILLFGWMVIIDARKNQNHSADNWTHTFIVIVLKEVSIERISRILNTGYSSSFLVIGIQIKLNNFYYLYVFMWFILFYRIENTY